MSILAISNMSAVNAVNQNEQEAKVGIARRASAQLEKRALGEATSSKNVRTHARRDGAIPATIQNKLNNVLRAMQAIGVTDPMEAKVFKNQVLLNDRNEIIGYATALIVVMPEDMRAEGERGLASVRFAAFDLEGNRLLVQ